MALKISIPSKLEFENNYKTMSFSKLAELYKVSTSLVNTWAKSFGLKGKRREIKVGEIIGCYTVLAPLKAGKWGGGKWEVQCICGKKFIKLTGHLLNSAKHFQSCGCGKMKGYKELHGKFWRTIVRNAKHRGKIFDLDIKEMYELYLSQNKKCALSGVDIKLGNDKERTGSLDRIDSNKDYTKDNVQWVHKKVNLLKNVLSENEFIDWCKLIYFKSIENT